MRLVGYVRVSRVGGREGDSFISPAVQRERIEKYAQAQDHTVVGWFEDLDQPGSRYERPGFQAALVAVEHGDAEGVAVAALDRFARSVPDAAVALQRLEATGGTLVSVRDALDTSTPVGRFARTMMLALAELELDRIRENWGIARDRAIARGVYISRIPPVGYSRGTDGHLEPDPVAGPIIREVFLNRAAGASWTELCQFLDQRLPRDHGSWTHQTVSSVVRRRAYLGEAHQGAAVNKHAHEPLVSRAEWEAAQTRAPFHPRKGEGALLAGLIRCAACGFAMSRASDGARGHENYRCRARHSSGVCPAPARISISRADSYVTEQFLSLLEDDPVRILGTPPTEDLDAAIAAVEAAEAELTAYRDAHLISIIGQDAYIAGLRERQRTLDEARSQLDKSRPQQPAINADLQNIWPELSPTEQRTILAAAIDAICIRRATSAGKAPYEQRIRIYWHGDAPHPLPGRQHNQLTPLDV
jgi:DNA invertase Pin-like site-specific DNA recombinase